MKVKLFEVDNYNLHSIKPFLIIWSLRISIDSKCIYLQYIVHLGDRFKRENDFWDVENHESYTYSLKKQYDQEMYELGFSEIDIEDVNREIEALEKESKELDNLPWTDESFCRSQKYLSLNHIVTFEEVESDDWDNEMEDSNCWDEDDEDLGYSQKETSLEYSRKDKKDWVIQLKSHENSDFNNGTILSSVEVLTLNDTLYNATEAVKTKLKSEIETDPYSLETKEQIRTLEILNWTVSNLKLDFLTAKLFTSLEQVETEKYKKELLRKFGL